MWDICFKVVQFILCSTVYSSSVRTMLLIKLAIVFAVLLIDGTVVEAVLSAFRETVLIHYYPTELASKLLPSTVFFNYLFF